MKYLVTVSEDDDWLVFMLVTDVLHDIVRHVLQKGHTFAGLKMPQQMLMLSLTASVHEMYGVAIRPVDGLEDRIAVPDSVEAAALASALDKDVCYDVVDVDLGGIPADIEVFPVRLINVVIVASGNLYFEYVTTDTDDVSPFETDYITTFNLNDLQGGETWEPAEQ